MLNWWSSTDFHTRVTFLSFLLFFFFFCSVLWPLLYFLWRVSDRKKRHISSPSIRHPLSFSEDMYLLRVIKAAGQSVSQARRKSSGGNEVALLCQTEIRPPPHLHAQSFLSYLSNVISRPRRKTKAPAPRCFPRGGQGNKRPLKHICFHVWLGRRQLPYIRTAGESHCVPSHSGVGTIRWVPCL